MTDISPFLHLPALSIQQPWAWLIANGLKDIENRDWWTKFRGDFLIHTGKRPDDISPGYFKANFGIDIPDNLPLGGIVGKSKLVACVTSSGSPWFQGQYGFVLDTSASMPLPFYPCRGRLGFFNLNIGETK